MKQLLVFKDTNDSIYKESFTILDYGEIEDYFKLAEIFFTYCSKDGLKYHFGDGDDFFYYNKYNEFHKCFTVKNINDSEFDVFERYFTRGFSVSFGEINIFEQCFFYDEIFSLYSEGKLTETAIEKLTEHNPEFKSWLGQS